MKGERSAENDEDRQIPTSYRDISFAEWLDVFLKYALCLSRRGDTIGAYDIISAAYDANVFYHSSEFVFLIHVCWAGNVYPALPLQSVLY